jgi:hypothetical protein
MTLAGLIPRQRISEKKTGIQEENTKFLLTIFFKFIILLSEDCSSLILLHTESGWLTVQSFLMMNRKPEIKPAEPALDNASEGNKIDTIRNRYVVVSVRAKIKQFPPVSVRSFLT